MLLLLAAAFCAAEPFVARHGPLSVSGAVCSVLGAVLLFDPAGEHYQVSPWVAGAIAATLALFTGVLVAKVVQVRRRPVAVGIQSLVGARGEMRRDGLVAVNGELWRARTRDGETLADGERVEVEAVGDGLMLTVRPLTPSASNGQESA